MSYRAFVAPSALPVHGQHARLCPRPRARPCTRRRPHPKATAAPSQTALGRVLTPDAPPAWDSGHLCSPVVRRYLSDEGARYVMWYSARPANWTGAAATPHGSKGGFAGLALSDDGLVWTRVAGPHDGAVLTPNSEEWWWFDTRHLSVGDVAIDSNDLVRADAGVYFMYYSGGDQEIVSVPSPDGEGLTDVHGLRMRIGVALSKDGENFSRIEGEYPSGAVVDVGAEGDFDELFVAGPTVIRPLRPQGEEKYIMHYFTYNANTKQYVIGSAVSKDGFAWSKRPEPALRGSGAKGAFDEQGVNRCCVVERRSGGYVMFVEVLGGDSTHRIAMCESTDCRKWGPLTLVLDVGEGDAWDDAGVSHPNAVLLDDGAVRLYYVGQSNTTDGDSGRGTCIGVAESDGEDWTVLTRIAQ